MMIRRDDNRSGVATGARAIACGHASVCSPVSAGRLTGRRRERARKLAGLIVSAFIFHCLSASAFAQQPEPVGEGGSVRHSLGIALAICAIAAIALLNYLLRLRKSAQATTPRDFFLSDKQVTASQYFDTTIAYSFQVVVTLFFIYWGFIYGIGMLYFAFTWLAGIYLFQLSAPRLAKFAVSEHTLHGFLAEEYGSSAAIRRITALCTLFGIIGGLLIEISLATDVVTSIAPFASTEFMWIAVFCAFFTLAWLYLAYGGFKSAVLVYAIQVPVVYGALSIVFGYLIFLAFRSGYFYHACVIGLLVFSLWTIIVLARTRGVFNLKNSDLSTRVAAAASLLTLTGSAALAVIFWRQIPLAESVQDTPDSFSLAAVAAQDKLIFIGFTILNVAAQFCDVTAWQRLSSVRLEGSRESRTGRLRELIGETKWESPVTWAFGIMFGIALRHSGLFNNSEQAATSLQSFVQNMLTNQSMPYGTFAAFVVLPCLLLALTSMMFSTTDSLLSVAIFTWMTDIARVKVSGLQGDAGGNNLILNRARRTSRILVGSAGLLFIVLHRILKVNIFLLLNSVGSAQFAIAFLSVGALCLKAPRRYRAVMLCTATASLVANFATAVFCYVKMINAPEGSWGDRFYVLPTIASAIVGIVTFAAIVAASNIAGLGPGAENRSAAAAPQRAVQEKFRPRK